MEAKPTTLSRPIASSVAIFGVLKIAPPSLAPVVVDQAKRALNVASGKLTDKFETCF